MRGRNIGNKFLSVILELICFPVHDCEFIEVTQSSDSADNGIYVRTDDRALTPTKSSTWKHPNEDRAIFNAESATEWRLGTEGHQNTNDYYFKGTYCISKYFFLSYEY